MVTAGQEGLVELTIHGTIDPALFWPGCFGLAAAGPLCPPIEPFWQHLEDLTVVFDPITPSGQWYFRGNDGAGAVNFAPTTAALSESQMSPGYGATEEEDLAAALVYSEIDDARLSARLLNYRYRLDPDETLLVPLIKAFTRACLQIPALRTAKLSTTLLEVLNVDGRQTYSVAPWGIHYAAPGARLPEGLSTIKDIEYRRLVLDTRDW